MKQKTLWIAAACLLMLDRAAKLLWCEADLLLWPGVLRLRGVRNTGMALGLMQGNARLLAILSALLIAAVLFFLRRVSLSRTGALAVGLLLGGAAGNLIDRTLYGYVIDFIEPLFVRFYIFNLADAGVTIGAFMLACALLFGKENKMGKEGKGHDA